MKSASQIGLWISCNRRAGWKYICKYPEPQHPSAALGTRVHKVLEDNKRLGLLIDRTTEEGAIAAEVLPYTEEYRYEGPDGAVQLEGPITVMGRHHWRGFKDLSAPGEIIDYKTSSDPFKWGKTPGELLADPQAILYAQHYYTSVPADAPTVKLRWLYLKTRKPYGAHPVELEMTREHAAAGFEVLERFADEMVAAENAAPADVAGKHKYVLTLAHDPSRCREYPPMGCPYRAHCTDIQPFSDPNSAERNNHMSVLDRLAALTAVAAPAAPAAAPPAPVAAPPEPNTIIPPGDGPLPYIPPDYEALNTAATPAAVQDARAAINPQRRGRGRPRKEADTIPVPALAEEPVASPAPVAQAAQQAGAVPARLDADRTAQPLTQITVEIPREDPLLPPPPPPPAPSPTVAELKAELKNIIDDGMRPPAQRPIIATLLVGCHIWSTSRVVEVVRFEHFVAKAQEMIGEGAYWQGYGYKTNGLMLQAIEKLITEAKPDTLIVGDARTPEATLALSWLRANAGVIVEGGVR